MFSSKGGRSLICPFRPYYLHVPTLAHTHERTFVVVAAVPARIDAVGKDSGWQNLVSLANVGNFVVEGLIDICVAPTMF